VPGGGEVVMWVWDEGRFLGRVAGMFRGGGWGGLVMVLLLKLDAGSPFGALFVHFVLLLNRMNRRNHF